MRLWYNVHMSAKTDLPPSLPESHALIEALLDENAHLNQKYNNLLEQLKLSRLRQFGSKSESNITQGELFDEVELNADVDEPEDKETITYHSQGYSTHST